jgi:L-alanine-DL-glutamate epimerase-like enolase superfamily enzyme
VSARIIGVSTAVVEANYDYGFVRVHTDEGVHGTGECFPTPALVPLLHELGEVLVGKDARQVLPLAHRLRHVVSGTGSKSGAGIVYNAISGIECALWDLAGKLDGRPVAEMLGGRFTDQVPVYMDCHAGGKLESMTPLMRYRTPWWMSESGETEHGELVYEAAEPDVLDLALTVARAKEAVAAGFRHLKFDLDVFPVERRAEDLTCSSDTIEFILDRALQLRTALGGSVELAFDCHWRFDVPTAVRIARGLEAVAPMWLEDPVAPEVEAMAAVRAQSPVPLATGENNYLAEGFRRLIDGRALDIVTPDGQKVGGLAEMKRVFDDAALAYMPAAPHCISSPLGLVATAHVAATVTNVLCVEWHGADVPFWHELLDTRVLDGGTVTVPNAPGLGVELDEEVVARYSRKGEPVFALKHRPAGIAV